jgi:hypothetical protein
MGGGVVPPYLPRVGGGENSKSIYGESAMSISLQTKYGGYENYIQ